MLVGGVFLHERREDLTGALAAVSDLKMAA